MDDHALVRAGLRALFATHDDIDVVGEADSGENCIQTIIELGSSNRFPDVVLLDIRMETGDSGLRTANRIRELDDNISIIMCTSFVSDEEVVHAVSAGARGYIVKDVSEVDIALAVRMAAAGFVIFGRSVFDRLVGGGFQTPPPSIRLTKREYEIVSFLAEGLSNHEIAEILFLSDATIKTHVSNLFSKLGVSSRSEAVAVADSQGFLTPRS